MIFKPEVGDIFYSIDEVDWWLITRVDEDESLYSITNDYNGGWFGEGFCENSFGSSCDKYLGKYCKHKAILLGLPIIEELL